MPEPASSQFYVDEEKPHLGGYIPGGDPATHYPDLWKWLVDTGVKSVVDIGCGEGLAARYFADRGCRVVGIDGVWQLSQNWQFLMHDYTQGPLHISDPFDLAWSCEFVEHVEEQYVQNFLMTFQCANAVLMTHAEPGQPGYHHVNCQDATYWKAQMAAAGFRFDPDFTRDAREKAAINTFPINHFSRSGLAFVRAKWPDDFRDFGSNVQPPKKIRPD